jgi:hypothetical protein
MIRDLFDGSRGHLTPPSREGATRGARTSRRAHHNHPEWAQASGLVAWLHLLDVPDRKQVPVHAHGIAEAD